MTDISEVRQPLAKLLGIEITEASKERVRGRLFVKPEICTAWETIHGGTVMSFADVLGATGAYLNLPEGASTTTMESKTNFIGGAKVNTYVVAESTPIHIGKRTSVWQTRITQEENGKLVAIVTQTQMVLG